MHLATYYRIDDRSVNVHALYGEPRVPRVITFEGHPYFTSLPAIPGYQITSETVLVGDPFLIPMTHKRAVRLVYDAPARTRESLSRALRADAEAGMQHLVYVTPELRHALEIVGDHPLYLIGHPAGHWEWNEDEPYLTCSICGSYHPTALPELAQQGIEHAGLVKSEHLPDLAPVYRDAAMNELLYRVFDVPLPAHG